MLATGGSMVATINLLKEKQCKSITSVSIISAPEGIKRVEEAHPDVEIYTGSIDQNLDENKYIVPGFRRRRRPDFRDRSLAAFKY